MSLLWSLESSLVFNGYGCGVSPSSAKALFYQPVSLKALVHCSCLVHFVLLFRDIFIPKNVTNYSLLATGRFYKSPPIDNTEQNFQYFLKLTTDNSDSTFFWSCSSGEWIDTKNISKNDERGRFKIFPHILPFFISLSDFNFWTKMLMLKVKMVSRHRAFQPNDTYPGNTEYINVLLG